MPLRLLSALLAVVAVVLLVGSSLAILVGCFGGVKMHFGVRLALALGGAVVSPVGVKLLQLARKLTAQDALAVLEQDDRPPVLYLRSFIDDAVAAEVPHQAIGSWFGVAETEEEQLALVLGQLGPVVAIGRPGEPLPQLGAARMYVGDHEWQAVVQRLLKISRLVVFRAKRTDGLFWEVEQAARRLRPEQILFLIPRDFDYEGFRRAAGKWFPHGLPPAPAHSRRAGSLRGFVYFQSDWTAVFLPPAPCAFRHRLRQALVPVMQMTLEPVFKQLGAPWKPPPIRWGLYATCLLLITWPCLLALVMLAVKWVRGG